MKRLIALLRQYDLYGKYLFFFSALVYRLERLIPQGFAESRAVFDELLRQGFSMRRQHACNIVENENVSFILRRDTSDPLVAQQMLILEHYGPVVQLFEERSCRIGSMVDAGANIGLATVYVKSRYPEARILALEPNASNHAQLEQNIELNGYVGVDCLKMGLWHEPAWLYPDHDFGDGRQWAFSLADSPNEDGPRIECVDAVTLMQQHDLTKIDFLKVDIEGAEAKVFLDPGSDLSFLSRVNCVAIEIHDLTHMNRYAEVLGNHGLLWMQSTELLIAYRHSFI